MLLKCPPIYIVVPLRESAKTQGSVPPGLGFQLVAFPVEASIAARPFLDCPPIPVNVPPAYSVEPLNTRAYTFGRVPVALGFQLVTVPDVVIAAIPFLV